MARESAAVITLVYEENEHLPVERKASLTKVTKMATCHALSSIFPNIGARVCNAGNVPPHRI
jgi:hypothetical protein